MLIGTGVVLLCMVLLYYFARNMPVISASGRVSDSPCPLRYLPPGVTLFPQSLEHENQKPTGLRSVLSVENDQLFARGEDLKPEYEAIDRRSLLFFIFLNGTC